MGKNYYELFGIKETASSEEIKEAYHRLIFKYHPDRNPNNEKCGEITRKIILINDTLTDASKRFEYNKELEKQRASGTKKTETTETLWDDELNNQTHYRERKSKYQNPSKQETYNYQAQSRKEYTQTSKDTFDRKEQTRNTNNGQFSDQRPPDETVVQDSDESRVSNQGYAKFFAGILFVGIIIYSYLISQKI